VWIPCYRRAILRGRLALRLEEVIGEVWAEREWIIEALTIQPDHVHLFVSRPPRDAPATVMHVIKSQTARVVRRLSDAVAAQPLGRQALGRWLNVGSAGDHVTAALIKPYIQEQGGEIDGFEPSN
jgi:putative transposase